MQVDFIVKYLGIVSFYIPKIVFKIRASLKAAVIVLPILGCTWIIGLLAINEKTAVFTWIFTILNSFQVNCTKN